VYGSRRLGIDQYNTAYLLFIAAVLFSVGWILNGIIDPILNYYRIASETHPSPADLFFSFLLTGAIYISIAYVFSIFIIACGVGLYTYMTPLKEVKELKENNIGVAIVLSVIILVLSLMCKEGVVLFIESIVPYPEFPPGTS